MALWRRRPAPGLIHHSDRGSQYCAKDYQPLRKKHGFQISMLRKGNCYDNAPIESFWGSLKKRDDGASSSMGNPSRRRDSGIHRNLLQSPASPLPSRLPRTGGLRPVLLEVRRLKQQCLLLPVHLTATAGCVRFGFAWLVGMPDGLGATAGIQACGAMAHLVGCQASDAGIDPLTLM